MRDDRVNKKIYSLFEVSKSIQKTLSLRYTSSFWVKAEMNRLNFYNHSGHCYPDLVEKREGKVIAQMRSVLWKDDYSRINKRFLEVLKEPLKDGVKILFLARISFTPLYGLTLVIGDIDPGYTLGDLEQEKQQAIKRLKYKGIFYNNHKLPFPLLPQRIAVISVETSKGYADFLRILENNAWNYKFFLHLFPALLQGDKAPSQIIKQLQRIEKVKHHFDAVAIIRGGGGDIGLSCYNDYSLASEIAQFPIPVLTGIGHTTNETVSEVVANTNAITPTKLAEFLLQKFHDFSIPVENARSRVAERARMISKEGQGDLLSEVRFFRSATENLLNINRNNIHNKLAVMQQQSKFQFRNETELLGNYRDTIWKSAFSLNRNYKLDILRLNEKLVMNCNRKLKENYLEIENLGKNIKILDPKNILKRGYSITMLNNRVITDSSKVKLGDSLRTIFLEGETKSTVIESQKTKK